MKASPAHCKRFLSYDEALHSDISELTVSEGDPEYVCVKR